MTGPMRGVPLPGPGNVTPVGPDRLARANAALDDAEAAAIRHGEHLWIVSAAYRLSPDAAQKLAAGSEDPTLLDGENLLSLAPGCYICEEPLTRRLAERRCRGPVS